MPHNPLYFLTYKNNPGILSGYGIPLRDGQKSRLVGMLMIARPSRCPENYIQELKETFGEAIIGPMTLNGDGGLFTQMRIQDPHSLDLVKNDLSAPNTEETRYVFELALRGGFLAKRRVKLRKISPAPSLPKRGISSFLQSLPAVGRGEKEGFNGLCCSLLSNYRKIEKIKWILGSPLSSIEDFDSNYPLIF